MAKGNSQDTIQLVAVERGFSEGRMVHPGDTFSYPTHDANGKLQKLPKWAQPADAPAPAPKKVATAVDLKPKAAQAAVNVKRAELAGATPDGSADSVDKTDLA